jgi:AcrR family transcriptional regulator
LEKNKRNRAATTERIMNALEQVLAEQGIEGVSMILVAEKAAVSKVILYRYFGNLDGLLEAYLHTDRLLPHYTSAWLEQIRPTHAKDIPSTWSENTLQLFRKLRASPSARELLKASVKENNVLADTVSRTLDGELTNLVNQLSFIKGSDHEAISAVMLGALSYLTIQAQLDRPVIGLDLRSEADWLRIEKAVRLTYQALAKLAMDSQTTHLAIKSVDATVTMR